MIQFGSSLDNFEEAIDLDFACDGLYDSSFYTFGAKIEELSNKNIDLIKLQPQSKFIDYISKKRRIIYESKLFTFYP